MKCSDKAGLRGYWVRSDGRNYRPGRRLGVAARKNRNGEDRHEAMECYTD